jgi:hypothetical protein
MRVRGILVASAKKVVPKKCQYTFFFALGVKKVFPLNVPSAVRMQTCLGHQDRCPQVDSRYPDNTLRQPNAAGSASQEGASAHDRWTHKGNCFQPSLSQRFVSEDQRRWQDKDGGWRHARL